MKPIFALFFITLSLAGNAFGQGSQNIIKQRAREAANQNSVRQDAPAPYQPTAPPGAPVAPGTPGAAAAAPALSAGALRLQSDLAAIRPDAPATTEQKKQLAKDILATTEGFTKPSQATADALAEKLAAACSQQAMSPTSRPRLARELDAVLNPTKYPTAKLDGIFSDVQAIFQDNGQTRSQAVAIADLVKTASTEVRK
jgi:hypothetical protein